MDREYLVLALLLLVLVAGVPLGRRALAILRAGPDANVLAGLVWYAVRLYNALIHRVHTLGREHLPPTNRSGPLLVVSNHSAGLDPLLIQGACRFSIRWMMARDTMTPGLHWFWRWRNVIAVNRDGADSSALREAIRHVRGGGAVGIFPEGGLPPRDGRLRAFQPGVGMLIKTCRAPVLLVWIADTPITPTPFGSLFRFSRSRVTFVDRITYPPDLSSEAIVSDLRRRLAEAGGCALIDEPVATARRPASSNTDVDPFAP